MLEEIIALPILGGQTVVCSSAKWNLTDFLLDRSLLGLSIDLLGERFMELLRKKSMELLSENSKDLAGETSKTFLDLLGPISWLTSSS